LLYENTANTKLEFEKYCDEKARNSRQFFQSVKQTKNNHYNNINLPVLLLNTGKQSATKYFVI